MRKISIKDVLKINRPVLGDRIPLAFWRILRLIAMPRVLGKKTEAFNKKVGNEIGKIFAVKTPEEIVTAITTSQIGICNPLEKKKGMYAIEFKECFTCSGITPPIGKPICDLEAAIIEGAFKKIGVKVKKVQETKCMGGLGDDVCRIEVETEK